eukprot:scaffold9044_cov120-Isochrysis_galbana.AAC.1
MAGKDARVTFIEMARFSFSMDMSQPTLDPFSPVRLRAEGAVGVVPTPQTPQLACRAAPPGKCPTGGLPCSLLAQTKSNRHRSPSPPSQPREANAGVHARRAHEMKYTAPNHSQKCCRHAARPSKLCESHARRRAETYRGSA